MAGISTECRGSEVHGASHMLAVKTIAVLNNYH